MVKQLAFGVALLSMLLVPSLIMRGLTDSDDSLLWSALALLPVSFLLAFDLHRSTTIGGVLLGNAGFSQAVWGVVALLGYTFPDVYPFATFALASLVELLPSEE